MDEKGDKTIHPITFFCNFASIILKRIKINNDPKRIMIMRSRDLLYTFALAAAMSACSEVDMDNMQGNSTGKEYNQFDFSTSSDVNVSLQYTLATKAAVYFEVYAQEPGTDDTEGNGYKLDESIEPIYAGFTDESGKFAQSLEIPAGTEKLYFYSPAFFAPTLLTADVSNGSATASYNYKDMQTRATRSVYETDQEYDSYMFASYNAPSGWVTHQSYKDCNWKDWLVQYDKKANGHVTNLYTGSELAVADASKLFSAHQLVINVNSRCDDKYRTAKDMIVTKPAEVALTFLGGNTCWSSSLGYYYYMDEAPKSLSDVNVIMLFPNTQDGAAKVVNNRVEWNAYAQAGINTGDCVQLMYYPNIDKGSKEGATTVFPMGCHIGLVLATNAWSNRMMSPTWGRNDKAYRASTTLGLSCDNNFVKYNMPRTAMYEYDSHVMISFEDHTDDQNFSDVVVTMMSNPIRAIESGTKVDKKKLVQDITYNKGVYLFEDLWPERGDYDMNDVMIKTTYTKTVNTKGKANVESFDFVSYNNKSNYTKTNGLAVRFDGIQGSDQLKFFRKKEGSDKFEEIRCDYESAEHIVLLADDVNAGCKDSITYRISVLHSGYVSANKMIKSVEPFIYRNEEGGRWEVHQIDCPPSSKMNMSLFDTGDDASDVKNKKYYRRDGNYPFALHLADATKANLIKLIRSDGTSISNQYPNYDTWVKSNGNKCQDWYKISE